MNPIFKQYKTVKKSLESNKREINQLRTERASIKSQPKTPVFSHITTTRQSANDKMLNNQSRLDEIELELNRLYIVEEENKILLEDLKNDIIEMMSSTGDKDSSYASVFYYKEIDNRRLTLEDIAREISLDEGYVRNISAELNFM